MIDIKGLREALKLSQKEMCEALDMPQPLLSAIENKKKPLPRAAYAKLYNRFGDMILNYKLPDFIIEVKAEEIPTKVEEPRSGYERSPKESTHPPMNEFLEYLKEKDAELREKEKEIRQLIRDLATLEAKLEIAKKGGHCLKETESDAGCVSAT